MVNNAGEELESLIVDICQHQYVSKSFEWIMCPGGISVVNSFAANFTSASSTLIT